MIKLGSLVDVSCFLFPVSCFLLPASSLVEYINGEYLLIMEIEK